MRNLICIICLLTTLTFTVQGQEKLEWSAKRKLTTNDFKGTRSDPRDKQTLKVGFEMQTNLKVQEIKNLDTFNGQVTNFFLPNESWIDWREGSRLRYAITLFDLNEWKARELRKRLNENRKKVLAGDYEDIRKKVEEEFQKMHQDYDSETESGDNIAGQLKWESRITEQLSMLADYCKSCGLKH
jgi:hypothetical protein